MITVERAKALVMRHAKPLGARVKPVRHALGDVLAETVCTPFALPVFDNAAMDGFAFDSREVESASPAHPVTLKIRGTIKAGDVQRRCCRRGEAFRIMTGAPVPRGADAVLACEEARVEARTLVVTGPMKRSNVHFRGEEMPRGTIVARRGRRLTPALSGVLASVGRAAVRVVRRPRVALIVTGSELVRPGRALGFGRIYDSNTRLLESALEESGFAPIRSVRLSDRAKDLKRAVRRLLKVSDVLILSGGVSVGDYDHVKRVIGESGGRRVFWRVKQKPGKPLFFARRGRRLIFGLPGNPAAVFTCFYEFVLPALRAMSGRRDCALKHETLPLGSDVRGDAARTLFLKAAVQSNGTPRGAFPLPRQGSHMITSLAAADGFIVLPPRDRVWRAGERVAMDLLPAGGGCAHDH